MSQSFLTKIDKPSIASMPTRLLQFYVRHFPVNKGKNRLMSLLWKPLLAGKRMQLETTLRQANIRISCDVTSLIQRQLYFWGSYEEDYCKYWIRLARQSDVVFDIGANVGLYSLLAAKTNPKAQIHAFDPTTMVLDRFETNIKLNDFQNIKVNALAIGHTCGEATLYECRGSDGTNEGMNFVQQNADESGRSANRVLMTTIDEYCQTNRIGNIDLMKMDIEGGEYDALLGAKNLLDSKSIKCLFVEMAEWAARRSGYSTLDILRLLRDRGYLLYGLKQGVLTELVSRGKADYENIIAFASGEVAGSATAG